MAHPVLIVEDDPDVQEVLAVFLEGAGHDVAVAGEGDQALRLLRGGLRPCVILLDIMMPVMDGIAFRRAQQADADLAGIPVIVVSGVAHMMDAARGLGVAAMLPKPVDPERMLGLIHEHCPL